MQSSGRTAPEAESRFTERVALPRFRGRGPTARGEREPGARELGPHVLALSRSFPIVTITGPRQSGKTTLCRQLFPDKPYVSLEALDRRAFATGDPRGFLAAYATGAVIDEVQRAPDLLSYLQEDVDAQPAPGRFVLTGSANLALLESVSQSLAGRTGLATLLPCSRPEYERFPGPAPALWHQVWRGGFPAIPDRGIPPTDVAALRHVRQPGVRGLAAARLDESRAGTARCGSTGRDLPRHVASPALIRVVAPPRGSSAELPPGGPLACNPGGLDWLPWRATTRARHVARDPDLMPCTGPA